MASMKNRQDEELSASVGAIMDPVERRRQVFSVEPMKRLCSVWVHSTVQEYRPVTGE
jgi:hypothetical protein